MNASFASMEKATNTTLEVEKQENPHEYRERYDIVRRYAIGQKYP